MQFTCSQIDQRGVWCCPCESREAFCICHGPGAHFLCGFCPSQSPWTRRATERDPASMPVKENIPL